MVRMLGFACLLSGLVLCLGGVALAKSAREVAYSTPHEPGTIIISNSQKRLIYVLDGDRAIEYDIAVGKPSEQWIGTRIVTRMAKNPTWTPTPSMRRKKPSLPHRVGPGPKNPLGVRAIYLGWSAYRIHGTNAPHSIGQAASSGCFRMYNEDVTDLYERVHIGAPVIVTN